MGVKKILLVFLAPFYLLFTIGLVLEAHYCMGRLAGTEIGLAPNQDDKCNKCWMDINEDANDHCCKDEVRVLKLDENVKPKLLVYDIQLPLTNLQVHEYYCYQLVLEDRKSIRLSNHSPPELVHPPLYLQNRVFRI